MMIFDRYSWEGNEVFHPVRQIRVAHDVIVSNSLSDQNYKHNGLTSFNSTQPSIEHQTECASCFQLSKKQPTLYYHTCIKHKYYYSVEDDVLIVKLTVWTEITNYASGKH